MELLPFLSSQSTIPGKTHWAGAARLQDENARRELSMIDCLRVPGASHLGTSLIPSFLERISVLTKPPPCLGSPQSGSNF